MYPLFISEDEPSEDVKLQFDSDVRFSDFPLHYDLIDSLTCNGYIFPSPVQYHLLSHDISENLLVQAKSGTGKTIAFTTYVINKLLFELNDNKLQTLSKEELLVLFISPTREICIQINDTVSTLINPIKSKYSITSLCCVGGIPIFQDIHKFNDDSYILLTSTPGRFIQLTKTNSIKALIPNKIKESLLFLLLDEADRLFDSCFINQIKYILNLGLNSQIIAFSATFPQEKLQVIKTTLKSIKIKSKFLKSTEIRQIQLCASLRPNEIKDDSPTINVYNKTFEMTGISTDQEDSILSISKMVGSPVLKNINFLLFDDIFEYSISRNFFDENDYFQWSCCINSIIKILFKVPFRQSIIFTNNGSLGYKITVALKYIGIPAMYINGRRSQTEREEIFLALKRSVCRIVVSSDLLARGIDVKRVDLVINIDSPIDKETFLHRAGRTGRFGQTGIVVCIPTCKIEHDSFYYIFNQLGIKYHNFSEYYSLHDNGSNKSNKEILEKEDILYSCLSSKNNLPKSEDLIVTCIDEDDSNFYLKVNCDLNSKVSENSTSKNSLVKTPFSKNILDCTNFLEIKEIDRTILDIWRRSL
ncbi:hypothetical protein FG386_000459 [Cryptosporidium ryanae]|uniref:uncharacterized protein n=1 Tax=Cryptosporidium ryanae TaxID=515981 RepID=UPI00351A2B2B|nr:hypothetical protein FG386_000459 [Cryptosporidium ryanae]